MSFNMNKKTKYYQYKNDIFYKLKFNFIKGKNILDIGCGDGSDLKIFTDEYKLKSYGIDIYKHKNINPIRHIHFKIGSIYKIPFRENCFDYIFLHDVLHHIDENKQSLENHIRALKELKRVIKKNGYIIIIEGNRYNPLFYPHMVLMQGHNHWKQRYFIQTINTVFTKVRYKFFECHLYPAKFIYFWKLYEKLMETFSPKQFLSYNCAIIKVEKKH